MKKLIAIFAVLLFAAPAMAADWSFYGSQRVHTFYINNDAGNEGIVSRPKDNGVGTENSGEDDDWGLKWEFAPGSRFGAKVKADQVSGMIEVGLNMNSTNGGKPDNGTVGGDGFVSARRAFGVWKFSDNASLKVGKDYTPVSNLLFGQAFDDDGNQLGKMDFYGGRPGQLGLQIADFEIAFATNPLSLGNLSGFTYTPRTGPAVTYAGIDTGDPDWNLPKVEARYTFKMGGFQLIPFGGINYFTIDNANSTTLDDEIDVLSYVLGGAAKANIGAFYINAVGAWGQNWANAKWSSGGNTDSGRSASATLKGDAGEIDDTYDAMSWLVGANIGLNFTPTIKFEIGAGYRVDDSDLPDAEEVYGWSGYAQAVLTLAPGVYLVPEVGFNDYGEGLDDDKDFGHLWYAGAKWQIDF
jgi:hypothetical protein